MQKTIYRWVTVICAALFVFLPVTPAKAAEKVVEFKCVAFAPVLEEAVKSWWKGMEMINNRFKDQVHFKLLGGPEVVPAFELHGATINGIVDVCLLPPSYYRGKLPDVEISDYTDGEWDEIVSNGFLEDNRKLHEKLGLHYLIDSYPSKGVGRTFFYVFLKKDAPSPADLAGRRIRVFPAISPFMKSLGANPVMMPPNDIYEALDKGVIDGFVDINMGIVDDYHYEAICKHFIPYGFYRTALGVLVNNKAWNRLPKDLQDQITKFTETEVVKMWQEYYNKANPAETKKLIDAGIKPVQWSEAQQKQYLSTAYRAGWESVEAQSAGFMERYGKKYWLHYK